METDSVIDALEGQLEMYRRLMKLAGLQHEFVAGGSPEDLMGVLRQRHEAMEKIGSLEAIVAPARKEWGEYIQSLEQSEKTRVEAVMAEIRGLLEEITTADRNDAMVLQQRKLNLGKQISQASSARQVNRNYATAAYGKTRGNVDLSQ